MSRWLDKGDLNFIRFKYSNLISTFDFTKSRCLDGWSRWIVKAVAGSPWSSSPMASPGMIHQRSYLSLSPSWSRYIFCKLLILAGFCNVGLSTRIRTRSHICHPTLTSVSSSMTEFVFLQMYRYIMIHINTMINVINCVFLRSGINTSAYIRAIGVNPHIIDHFVI